MRWSKLRQIAESRFAPCLVGRVRLESTHYRKAHDQEGRVGIVIDGEQVWCMGCIGGDRAPSLFAKNHAELEGVSAREAQSATKGKAEEFGFINQYAFHRAVWDVTQMRIEEALASDNAVIRALAYLDARTGKRRLVDLAQTEPKSGVERSCLAARLAAENIPSSWTST